MTATDTSTCRYLPRAPYIGGPLDGTAAAPLRRKHEAVHPQYRTATGKTIRGDQRPTGPHYSHVADTECGCWSGHYEYAISDRSDGGQVDVACTACDWARPAVVHGPDEDTAERTDRIAATSSVVKAHAAETGHAVRWTLTTFTPGRTERSSMLVDRTGRSPWADEWPPAA